MAKFRSDFLNGLIDQIAATTVRLFQHIVAAACGFREITKGAGIDTIVGWPAPRHSTAVAAAATEDVVTERAALAMPYADRIQQRL